ncbi:MAG: hypothetical protein LBF68_05860 [Christensenellaceae bacterium]|nr:hypothetical protein [Christensenellaceae bacterium]
MENIEIGTYKKIAQLAKRRMRLNDYADIQEKKEIGILNKNFYLGFKTLTANETCDYYRRVSELQTNGKISSAIGCLLDLEHLAKLDATTRERSVFAMGKLYRELKATIENNNRKY